MEWILIAGALCLSTHRDICITVNDRHGGFVLESPLSPHGAWYDHLAEPKHEGEVQAKELEEFKR